jgi:hypothetical protein
MRKKTLTMKRKIRLLCDALGLNDRASWPTDDTVLPVTKILIEARIKQEWINGPTV